MRLLRAQDRTAAPWKNGGGLTWQIAAHPCHASLQDFDWRISMARIEKAGPFSCFAGVERCLLLLEGRLNLEFDGERSVELLASSPAVSFSGEARVSAQPLEGSATDLNVMTRAGLFTARVTRHAIAEPFTYVPRAHTSVLLVLGESTAKVGGEEMHLQRHDAIAFAPHDEPRPLIVSSADIGTALIIVEIDPASASTAR